MSAELIEPGVPTAGSAVCSAPALAQSVLDSVTTLSADAPAVHAASWSWEERSSAIATLDRVTELVALYRSRLLSAHKADGRWARRGDRSFESYRGRTAQTGWGPARREMELADGLAELPQAARAVEEGQVGLAHAGVLTRLNARGSRPVRDALAAGGADELLAIAKEMDAASFAKRAEAWAASQDAQAVEQSHEETRRSRFCRLVERDGGTKVEGFLDVVAGAALRTALEALTPVPSPDDERTPEQRRADALQAMAARVLDRGQDKIGAQIRPHIVLLVQAETWAAIRARGGSAAAAGAGEGPKSVVMPELDDGTVLPLSKVERTACDCEMTRVVLDAEGVPLDVGRTQRTHALKLRRAALVRDRHCRWPGCSMRASWCEVHRVRWYSDGGRTSLSNALTLCSCHHHEVHRRHVRIMAVVGGHTFALHDGTPIGVSQREVPDSSRRRRRPELPLGTGEGVASDPPPEPRPGRSGQHGDPPSGGRAGEPLW